MSQAPHESQAAPANLPNPPDAPPDPDLIDLLTSATTVAVVGVSTRDGRPANFVPAYLAGNGYRVMGVNPLAAGESLFGNKVVSTLAELDQQVDIVNVFRRNEDIPSHLDDILSLNPRPRAVWIQRGLRHDETAAALRAAGITVVQDRCLMVEHRRLLGQTRTE